MQVKLTVLEGIHKDRVIPLPETIFLIGRDKQCHLRPHCELVSQLHCAIAAWGGKVRVRDLKSRNGTLLNGQPIHGEAIVGHGDRLQVGTLVFALRIEHAEDGPLPEPIEDQSSLQWLLTSRPDSSVLEPGYSTAVLRTRAEAEQEADVNAKPAAAAKKKVDSRGSKSVSAGQHLHDYVKKRQRR